MKNFLERLNICRNGRSVSEFARLLGINQKTLDFYIKGERKPSVELIVSVCSKCNVSANWLLGLPEHSSNAEMAPQASFAEQKLRAVKSGLQALLNEL